MNSSKHVDPFNSQKFASIHSFVRGNAERQSLQHTAAPWWSHWTVAGTGAWAASRPDVLATLHLELAQLPPQRASALADYLNSLPQPMLASALVQLQNGSANGVWRGL